MANSNVVRHVIIILKSSILGLIGVICFLWFSRDLVSVSDYLKSGIGPVKNNSTISDYLKSGIGPVKNNSNIIPFCMVLCKGTDKNKRMSQQIKQARMVLKSAAVLTKTNLWFKIFTDSELLYGEIVQQINTWPQEYQRRLHLDLEIVRYPNASKSMEFLYRPCATYRLLFPDVLQDIDAVVYLDTDSLFLSSPEKLLEEFNKFDEKEAVAMAWDYLSKVIKVPYAGRTGFNSGVLLLNLTRLRNLPGGGFVRVINKIYLEYKEKLTGDQCLLNAFFSTNPQLLYELSCEWNYFFLSCQGGRDSCLDSLKHGASLVHGAGNSFANKLRFLGLFEAWEEYEFGTSIMSLGMRIQEKIANYASLVESTREKCTKSLNSTNTFSKRLLFHKD